MAEAVAKSLSNGRWEIWSAGSAPSGRVHPLAVELMAQMGLDLSSHRSKGLDELPDREWDYVVTMGCADACPAIRARRRLDWALADPVGMPLSEARRIRDEIIERVGRLMATETPSRGNTSRGEIDSR
jgi:protein-tyrosine-phosphatase